MSQTKLAFVVHFHQPVGNLDGVVRKATERCYRPFLEVLREFPDLKLTLHYSGCLLEWLETNEPDVTGTLTELIARGQVELMTGGFYEPVLAALPHVDRVGQIEMLTDHLRDRYNADPTGLWLTERVWEQDVVAALTEANVRHTVLDDTMFHSVGITDDQLTGPFVTEHEDRPLLIYAGDRNLRYLIPYKRVKRVIDYLRSAAASRLFVYADDGEKFGEWPDTHERVYGRGWLRDFFEELVANSDWLEVVHLGEHAATAAPVGRAYLPSSSYDEMMTWALPNEARLKLGKLLRRLQKEDAEGHLPFVRGAPWRNFLAKYPEVNHLQKRMIHVSRHVHAAGDPPEALRELYRAQCNCAYWHGAFGGVYLGFMRTALWHHLMRAEAMAQANLPSATAEAADIDADVRPELILNAPWGSVVLAPHRGGTMVELDNWSVGANLLAVMTRREEAYHLEDENPPEEPEEDDEMEAIQARTEIDREELTFDDHLRAGLVDILDGRRIDQEFDHEIEADGLIKLRTDVGGITIEKQLGADADDLLVVLTLTNGSNKHWSGTYASETSIHLLNLGRKTEGEKLDDYPTGWRLYQDEAEISLEVDASQKTDISYEPIETGSATLEGLQKMRQGTAVTMTWRPSLDPGASFSVELRWRMLANPEAAAKKERGVSA